LKDFSKYFDKYNADAILLQSSDDFTFEHRSDSVMSYLTGFSGTAGEAILTKNGKIFLFVDPRYHIQASNSAKEGVQVVKMQLGETFIKILPQYLDINSKLLIDEKFIKFDVYENIKKVFKNTTSADFVNRYPKILSNEKIDNSRIEKLKTKLKKYNFDNIFITNNEHVSYLTNINSFDLPYSSTIRAKLLIGDKNILIFDETPEIFGKTLIFKDNLSLHDCKKVKEPILIKKNYVAEMMSVKSKKEIEGLKLSFQKLDCALHSFKKKIKVGLSEYELNKIFEEELFKAGAKALSFKTILSVDENTASIHYSSYDKNKFVKPNSLILLDCGGFWESPYATDITRVFAVGDVTDEQKRIYTYVLKAFLNCYHSDFSKGFELDGLARSIFKKAKIKDFIFPHALGHGLGLNVHSFPPSISPSGKSKLKKGMTFTIEPGLYLENKFGIRLENSVYIGDDGIKHSFSKFPFEEKLIDKTLLTKKEIKYLEDWQNGR